MNELHRDGRAREHVAEPGGHLGDGERRRHAARGRAPRAPAGASARAPWPRRWPPAVVIASIGWMARSRTKRCAPAAKSCAMPAASDGAGKSVSPRAVTAPLAPTTSIADEQSAERHRHADGRAGRAERSAAPPDAHHAVSRRRGEQQERVDQVKAHAERALHRRVVRDELEQHEPGADERLGDHERRGHGGAAPDPVPARIDAHRPDEQDERPDERAAAREAVRELDQRLDARRARQDLAVAHRPVPAAPRAGARGAHVARPRPRRGPRSRGGPRRNARSGSSAKRDCDGMPETSRRCLADAPGRASSPAPLHCRPRRRRRPLDGRCWLASMLLLSCLDSSLEAGLAGPTPASRRRMSGFACSASSARRRCRAWAALECGSAESARASSWSNARDADGVRRRRDRRLDPRREAALGARSPERRARPRRRHSQRRNPRRERVRRRRALEGARRPATSLETALRVLVDALTGLSALHNLRDASDREAALQARARRADARLHHRRPRRSRARRRRLPPAVRDRAPRRDRERVSGARSAAGGRLGRRARRHLQRRRHALGGAEPAPLLAEPAALGDRDAAAQRARAAGHGARNRAPGRRRSRTS